MGNLFADFNCIPEVEPGNYLECAMASASAMGTRASRLRAMPQQRKIWNYPDDLYIFAVLLAGGDESTQSVDIARAIELAATLED